MWSSGQSSWLQIQISRVRFPVLPDFLRSDGSGTGSTQLMRTIEELLGRNSSGFGLGNREYGRGDPLRWARDTLYPQKLALTSPTCGGRSVGIVRLRTKTTRSSFFFCSCGCVDLGHSLMRGRVCCLQLLLALASAVILGSEYRGIRDHMLVSQIGDFPFRRLLRLAGSRWRYSTTPPQLQKSKSKSKSKLLYGLPFTAHQFILASGPLRPTTRDFVSTELLR
jgi:hypothetical protein